MFMAKQKKNIELSRRRLDQLQAVVNRYCLSLTGSEWDAEDLAQDTWLKALDTLLGHGHQNSEALMMRIAKNTWIDQARRKTTLSHILQRALPELTQLDHGTLEIEMVFEALRKHLSPLQRAVFLLRDVFGYTNQEASVMLHTSEGAVKAALHRARLSLEAVKDDLEKGTLAIPEKEGLKSFLRALTSAYQLGEIARLVDLVQQDVVEPAVAIGIAQTRLLRRRQAESQPATPPTAHMAA
jgi:RNA polymerase sigma factor (sigma-70 family)